MVAVVSRVMGWRRGGCAVQGLGEWCSQLWIGGRLQLGLWDPSSTIALDSSFPSLWLMRSKLRSFHRVEEVRRVVVGFMENSGRHCRPK